MGKKKNHRKPPMVPEGIRQTKINSPSVAGKKKKKKKNSPSVLKAKGKRTLK